MTIHVDQFRRAQRAMDNLTARWNALTPEGRAASDLDFSKANVELAATAAALIAEASPRHTLTVSVSVTLALTPEGGWRLDAEPHETIRLDQDGPEVDAGSCDRHGVDADGECHALADALELVNLLPDAEQVATMIIDHNVAIATVPVFEPEGEVDYYVAQSAAMLHQFRKMRGPADRGVPWSWCGVQLVDQVRAQVGQPKCSRCIQNRAKHEGRNGGTDGTE